MWAATVSSDCVLVTLMLNFLLLITAHVLGGGLFHTQSDRPVDDYNSNNWTRVLPFMAELKSIAEHIQRLSSLLFWCLIQAKACIYLPAMSHCSSQVASCCSSISLWNKDKDPQFSPRCTRLLFQPGGHASPWRENQKQTRLPVNCLRKDGINNNGLDEPHQGLLPVHSSKDVEPNTTDEAESPDWPHIHPHIYTLFGLQIFGNEMVFKWWKDPTQLHTKTNMTESASNKLSSPQIVGMPARDTWNRRHPACKLLYLINNGFCVNCVCHCSSKAAPRRGTKPNIYSRMLLAMNLAKTSILPATGKWQLPWYLCYFLQSEWGTHPLIYTPTLIQRDQNKGPHTNRPNSADKTRLWTQHSFHTLRNLSSVWRHSIPEGPGAAASILTVYFESGGGESSPEKKSSRGLKAKTLEQGGVHILLTSGDAVISRKASSWIYVKFKKEKEHKNSPKKCLECCPGSGGRTAGCWWMCEGGWSWTPSDSAPPPPRGPAQPAALLDLGSMRSKQSGTHQLMPNIWRISHVRPIRAELTDPKEMPSCSCTSHSAALR